MMIGLGKAPGLIQRLPEVQIHVRSGGQDSSADQFILNKVALGVGSLAG